MRFLVAVVVVSLGLIACSDDEAPTPQSSSQRDMGTLIEPDPDSGGIPIDDGCMSDDECEIEGQFCIEGQCDYRTLGCQTDLDCGSGYACVDDDCIAASPCTTDEDCGEGRVCTESGCLEPTSCDGVVCPNGEACVNGACQLIDCADLNCPEGQDCVNGACVDPALVACDDANPCADGFICVDNDCVARDAGQLCANSCRWANDGICDDGLRGATTTLCAPGTDCNDCSPRDNNLCREDAQCPSGFGCQVGRCVESGDTVCEDTCIDWQDNSRVEWTGDGSCDDGGSGASHRVCALGTDCTDCGPRGGGPAACIRNNDCPSGQTCVREQCRGDSDPCDGVVCADAGWCVGGQCYQEPEAMAECMNDADCLDGVCDNGTCRPDGMMGCGGVECAPGERCEDDVCRPIGNALCEETCQYSGDGMCDDGGPDARTSVCDLGTDCMDCGVRDGEAPQPMEGCQDSTDCAVGERCSLANQCEAAPNACDWPAEAPQLSVNRPVSASTFGKSAMHDGTCGGGGREFVYWFTGTGGDVCLLAEGDFAPTLHVRNARNEAGEAGCTNAGNEVACVTGAANSATSLNVETNAGDWYYVFVDGRGANDGGEFVLTMVRVACP